MKTPEKKPRGRKKKEVVVEQKVFARAIHLGSKRTLSVVNSADGYLVIGVIDPTTTQFVSLGFSPDTVEQLIPLMQEWLDSKK